MTDKARELIVAMNEVLADGCKIPDTMAYRIAADNAINAALRTAPAIPEELNNVAEKIKHFDVCAEDSDSDGCDISRDWFDALTTIGLLERVQRSPAMWQMTEAGQSLVDLIDRQPASGDRTAPEGLKFSNAVIDKMQAVMAVHGFAVPVRVISDAFRTAMIAAQDGRDA